MYLVQLFTSRHTNNLTMSTFRLQVDTGEGAWGKEPAVQDTVGTIVVNRMVARKVVALVVAAVAMKGRGTAEVGSEGGVEGG